MRRIEISIPVPSRPQPIAWAKDKRAERKMHAETKRLVKLNDLVEPYPTIREFWDAHCILMTFALSDTSFAGNVAAERQNTALAAMLNEAVTTPDPAYRSTAKKVIDLAAEESLARATSEEKALINALAGV